MKTQSRFEEVTLANSGLKRHEMIGHIPRWADTDPRALAIRRFIQGGGEIDPIKVTPDMQIIDPDSVERWWAACLLKLDTVPVQIYQEEDAELVGIHTLVNRRHLSKSALAYLTYPMMKPAFEAAREKKLEMLKKGNVSPKSPLETTGSVEALAEQIGIARNLFFEAKKVHEYFAKDAEYKAQMEPRILAEPVGGEHEQYRPVGLGAVIAGYQGRNKTLDQSRKDRQQMELFTGTFGTFFTRFDYWRKADTSGRTAALKAIRDEIADMPQDKCSGMAEMLSLVVKELRDRAKSTKAQGEND